MKPYLFSFELLKRICCTVSCMATLGLTASAQMKINKVSIDTITLSPTDSKNLIFTKGTAAYTNGTGGIYIDISRLKDYKFGRSSGFTNNITTLTAVELENGVSAYVQGIPTKAFMRRTSDVKLIDNTVENYPRDLFYMQGKYKVSQNVADNDTVLIKTGYNHSMEEVILLNDISIGVDNIFSNQFQTNNANNIERVDIIFENGITIDEPSGYGFSVFERGTTTGHDNFTVGVITSKNAENTPLSYFPQFINVTATSYGNDVYTIPNDQQFLVLRRSQGKVDHDSLRLSAIITNQAIGGVYLSLSNFNIPPNTVVYGYSIFSNDFKTATSSLTNAERAIAAVDYNNPTYFPTLTSESDGGIDMSMVAGLMRKVIAKGTVYYDKDGILNNQVDGTILSNINNQQLYVYLVNTTNNAIIEKSIVDANGEFIFEKLNFSNLKLVVSTQNLTVTTSSVLNDLNLNLPNSWEVISYDYGENNTAGSGVKHLTVDSTMGLRVKDMDVLDLKIGIQQKPIADNKSFYLGLPPAINTVYLLNQALDQTSGGAPSNLTGSDDNEVLNSTNNNNFKVEIVSLPSHGNLYYDNVLITTPIIIENYDYNKLSYKFEGPNIRDIDQVAFNYAVYDNANARSNVATYTLNWAYSLDIKLSKFDAVHAKEKNIIDWNIEQYDNAINSYSLQKSNSGKLWETIHHIEYANATYEDYDMTDTVHYYRIMSKDMDGNIFYSMVKRVVSTPIIHYKVSPNPATTELVLEGVESVTVIQVFNTTGQLIATYSNQQASVLRMDISTFLSGVYTIRFIDKSGNITHTKLLKL